MPVHIHFSWLVTKSVFEAAILINQNTPNVMTCCICRLKRLAGEKINDVVIKMHLAAKR